MPFLPIKKEELNGAQADFVLVTGDAYVDHPSFGHALISRLLESLNFKVAIIAGPVTDKDFMEFGKPKIAFLISGGVVDSMVNNYTVAKRRRSKDVYGVGSKLTRPDRAVTVYSKTLKRLYNDTPVVIGGIEASLRRFAHYDYWSNSVMPSILLDSKADLLIYGMGEKPFFDIVEYLNKGIPINKIRDIEGTAYLDTFENLSKATKEKIESKDIITLPSFEEVKNDKLTYAKAFHTEEQNTDHINSKILIQKHNDKYLVVNKPQAPLTEKQLDYVFDLPYMRTYHTSYIPLGGVSAIEEVQFSLMSQRGCFGSCNFCALTYHQGRIVQSRSHESIINEAKILTDMPNFKGYIHDVGGPTANFYKPACDKQLKYGACVDKVCIGYKPCTNLKVDHSDYLKLLRELRVLPKVKKVFIRSGIRFDYLMMDKNDEFFNELVKYHISGQLKVAPEHTEDNVLKAMNKPSSIVYLDFAKKYKTLNLKYKKNQFLVPYLISSHPNCSIGDAVKVAEYLKSINYMPEQVQDFYPTPSTKSTTMYYTGINPDNMQKVYVPTDEEKALQRALLQYRKKENYYMVVEALKRAKRTDLIGFDEKKCLIRPLRANSLFKNKSIPKH